MECARMPKIIIWGGLGGLRENRGRNDGLKNPVGDPQSGWGGGVRTQGKSR